MQCKIFQIRCGEGGSSEASAEVDEDDQTISIEKVPVLMARAGCGELELKWECKSWESWEGLTKANEYLEILKKGKDKLAEARRKEAKIIGKGKEST